MPTTAPVELQTLIDFLAETPARVRQLVHNLSAADVRRKPSGQEFSALEQVCHLNDLEREGYAVRIERLIQEEHPFLPDFDGDKIARERDYQARPLDAMLDAFSESRRENLRAVNRLSEADFERQGTLEGVGPITLGGLLLKMREHDEAHLRELSDLPARLPGR